MTTKKPESLKYCKGILEIKNTWLCCTNFGSFKWATTRSLHPVRQNSKGERVTRILMKQAEQYNWAGKPIPKPRKKIPKGVQPIPKQLIRIETATPKYINNFEKLNEVSILVFEWSDYECKLKQIRTPQVKYEKTATLLLHNNWYSVIKYKDHHFSKEGRILLTSTYPSKNKDKIYQQKEYRQRDEDHHRKCIQEKKYFCSICDKAFGYKSDLEKHFKTKKHKQNELNTSMHT